MRIQDWLGRTPSLKLRRGGSVLLVEATQDSAFAVLLPRGVEPNPEAGHVDGVIAVRWPATAVVEPAPLAVAISRHLRRQAPQLALRGATAQADSYVAAYPELERQLNGEALCYLPAPDLEVVLAKPCDACRQAPADVPGIELSPGRRRDLCQECHHRWQAAGGTKGDWERRSPLPEQRMRDALRARDIDVGFPDDFYRQVTSDDGRGSGRREDRHSPEQTHLALIYADGNRVGAFLGRAAQRARERGKPAKHEIVVAIERATIGALADAVLATYPPREGSRYRPPVLAHLAGGDDLQVTVPAPQGWPFTVELVRSFGRRIADQARDWQIPDKDLPTLSAGLVFHHYAHPFNDAVTLATRHLKSAKKQVRGTGAAIDFLDVTVDGAERPRHRQACHIDWLDAHHDLLSGLAAVPNAHRRTLIDHHRHVTASRNRPTPPRQQLTPVDDHRQGMPSEASKPETAEQALARAVVNQAHDAVKAAVCSVMGRPTASAQDIAAALETSEDVQDGLRRFLDIAQWWPSGPGQRTSPPARDT